MISRCNYDILATDDDRSCTYAETYFDCNGDCLNDTDEDDICDELVYDIRNLSHKNTDNDDSAM